jgi:hypothetical protein
VGDGNKAKGGLYIASQFWLQRMAKTLKKKPAAQGPISLKKKPAARGRSGPSNWTRLNDKRKQQRRARVKTMASVGTQTPQSGAAPAKTVATSTTTAGTQTPPRILPIRWVLEAPPQARPRQERSVWRDKFIS